MRIIFQKDYINDVRKIVQVSAIRVNNKEYIIVEKFPLME